MAFPNFSITSMKFQILCCVITASTAKHGDNTTEPEFSINADVMPVQSTPTPDRNMILNLGHSMIKKFVVPLNSTLISPHIDTYAYKPKSKPCWINPQGWVNANGPSCPVRSQKWQWLGSQNHWLERQSIRSPQVISAQNDNQAHHDVDNNMLEVPPTIKPDVEPFWFPELPETWSSGAALSPLQCPDFFTFGAKISSSKSLRLQSEDVDMRFHLSSETRLQRLQQPTDTDSQSKQVVRGEVTELLLSIQTPCKDSKNISSMEECHREWYYWVWAITHI